MIRFAYCGNKFGAKNKPGHQIFIMIFFIIFLCFYVGVGVASKISSFKFRLYFTRTHGGMPMRERAKAHAIF